jgi:hypothetical protein
MADLLLHSMKEFDEVIFEIIDRLRPRGILEIGAETGAFTDRLLAYCSANAAKLVSIDPAPNPRLIDVASASEVFDLVIGLSLPYLEQHSTDAELVLIDGDHNYFTVRNELELVHAGFRRHAKSGAVLLHDVGFPCARRDFYYAPATIPAEARHPYSYELGVTVGSDKLVTGGFRGEGNFAWALAEGGERNGVLTAIDDFVKAHPEYHYRSIDAVFGLGALTELGSAPDSAIAEVFARYDNALVRRLERNRLELYLKVIELQDLLNKRGAA